MAESARKMLMKVKGLAPAAFGSRIRSRNRPHPQGTITALDLDGQTLRIVQASLRGTRVEVVRVDAVPLDLPADADRADPAVMGKGIARALAQLRLKPGAVVMGVSRSQVVLRTLTVPIIADIRELASMVHFQVGRDLPFSMQEAVVDFKVRRQIAAPPHAEPSAKVADAPAAEAVAIPPKLEVLVAAVRREVVDFCEAMAAAAGLKLFALGLQPYANARCVEACRVTEGDQVIALVSLRPDEVFIDLIADRSLLFSRGTTVKLRTEPPPAADAALVPPPDQLPEPSPGTVATAPAAQPAVSAPATTPATSEEQATFAGAVTIEVVRTLHSYSGMEPGGAVAKVVVTGSSGQESAVVEVLNQRLNIPCTVLDPVGPLQLPVAAGEQASGSIAAIGLILGVSDPDGLPFDFLNPKRPAVQRDLRRIRLLAGAVAVAALLVLLLSVRTHLVNGRQAIHDRVKQDLAEAEKKRSVYRAMRQQTTTVNEWLKGGRDWLEHYAYLSAILPPSEEVYVTSLAISGQGAVRLSVQARSGETLAKLDKQLRAAGYDVKPLAITPGTDRHGYDFRSTVEFTIPDKMKLDLAKVRIPTRPADDASLDPSVQKGGLP